MLFRVILIRGKGESLANYLPLRYPPVYFILGRLSNLIVCLPRIEIAGSVYSNASTV